MRTRLVVVPCLGACMLAASLVSLAAQAGSEPQKPSTTKADPDKPVTLNGCVTRDGAAPRQFTFTDSADGSQYRLSGRDVSKFSGLPVQIVGIVDTRRIRVVGGLTPSPNVAAQAGAIDPGKAAVAAIGGGTSATGSPELPTFKVTRVNLTRGECRR